MTKILQDGQYIRIPPLEVRILIALLSTPLNSYGVGRRCDADLDNSTRVSNGSLLPALKNLILLHAVNKDASGVFNITSLGRQVLKWELARYQKLIQLAKIREL